MGQHKNSESNRRMSEADTKSKFAFIEVRDLISITK